MKTAIKAFNEATTEAEVRAAYNAMLEWSEAPEGSEGDDVDNTLNMLGLPSLSERLVAVAA